MIFAAAILFAFAPPSGASAALVFTLAPTNIASAYTEKTLHSFCTESNCGDGEKPAAGLLRDASGNLYGTTPTGGKYGHGLVFKLIPNPETGKYKEYILHNFCARANCMDGSNPQADVIMDVDGNLYGTTENGGANNNAGAVFKLTHGDNGWSLAVLHNFCSVNLGAECADGKLSVAGLTYAGQAGGKPWDESSPLFGTTLAGGQHGRGLAFKLVSNGGEWQELIIHDFDSAQAPLGLIMDPAGNLFGMTVGGGKYGSGILYRLAAGTWKETIFHNFCAEADCADGDYPVGRLAMDAAGDLFGMTERGGCEDDYCGVFFERKAGGGYSVIHVFGTGIADGISPMAGPIIDAGGNLYGTTHEGGTVHDLGGGGTVFRLSYDSGKQQWREKTLHTFSGFIGNKRGSYPKGPVIIDGSGNLYGTTSEGGVNGVFGTVFELQP